MMEPMPARPCLRAGPGRKPRQPCFRSAPPGSDVAPIRDHRHRRRNAIVIIKTAISGFKAKIGTFMAPRPGANLCIHVMPCRFINCHIEAKTWAIAQKTTP